MEEYPLETCGLLVGRIKGEGRQVLRVVRARNLDRERPRDRYTLDPRDFLRADREASRQGLEIVGIWHSHPDHPARPSATDLAAAWEGYSYVIAKITCDGVQDIRSWRLVGDQFEEERLETS